MRGFIFLLLLLSGTPASAQNYPVERVAPLFRLEVLAGANLAINRKPRPSRISSQGAQLLPGYRLGLAGNLSLSNSRTSLLFSLDFIQDRMVVTNYTKNSSNSLNGGPLADRFRTGELDINETHLRGAFGVRIDWKKISLISAFSVSGFVGGGQTYAFEQRTSSVIDPFTGLIITLAEPLVSSGSVEYPTEALRRNTYGALVVAPAYRLTPRLSLSLELELGVQLGGGVSLSEEYKQHNARLGLVVGYRIFGQL